MGELTQEQAIELAESKFWEKMTQQDIAEFQLFTPQLCMPFDVFHQALETALGRPVWTHELGLNAQGIKDELMLGKRPPTLTEIMDLIPEDKRMIVVLDEEASGGGAQ